MAKLSKEKMQKIVDERARTLNEKYGDSEKRKEMAKYKAFGIPEEQRAEFIQSLIKKLSGD